MTDLDYDQLVSFQVDVIALQRMAIEMTSGN